LPAGEGVCRFPGGIDSVFQFGGLIRLVEHLMRRAAGGNAMESG
jgi:hypothetical protein